MGKNETQQVAVRLDSHALAVLEAYRARLETGRPGEKVTTSDAIRSLIMRGVEPIDLKKARKSA